MKKEILWNKIYHFLWKETKINFQTKITWNRILVLLVQNDITQVIKMVKLF